MFHFRRYPVDICDVKTFKRYFSQSKPLLSDSEGEYFDFKPDVTYYEAK
jgi:predicted transcriptional regulator